MAQVISERVWARHLVTWFVVLAFEFHACCAWLSYRSGFPSWINDENHFHGLFFPIVSWCFAPVAGVGAGRAYHWFRFGLGRAKLLAISLGTRSALIMLTIFAVRPTTNAVLLFIVLAGVSLFWPFRIPVDR